MANEEYNPDWFSDQETDVSSDWFSDISDPADDPTEDMSEVSKGVASGWGNLKAIGGGVAGIAGSAIGSDSLRDWGLEKYQKETQDAQKYQGRITDYAEIDWSDPLTAANDSLDFALFHIGSAAPMFIPAAIGGGLGSMAAKKLAEKGVKEFIERETKSEVAKGVAKEQALKGATEKAISRAAMAQKLGATTGVWAGSSGLESGSIYGDIYEKTGEHRALVSVTAGVLAGGVDSIAFMPILNRMGFGEKAKEEIMKKAADGLGMTMLKTGSIEAPTEAVQTAIERAAVEWVDENQKAFTPEGLHEIANASLAGFFGGTGLGGAGHIVTGGPLFGRKLELIETPEQKQLRIDKAKEDTANRGGDGIDVEIAGAQAALDSGPTSNPATTVDEVIAGANKDVKTETIAGEWSGPVPIEAEKAERQPAPRDEFGQVINRNNVALGAGEQSQERHNGIDGLINAAVDMGFHDEAVRLTNAKRLYIAAAKASANGDRVQAGKFADRANKIYQDITVGPMAEITVGPMAEITNQFPIPYVSRGAVEGGEIAAIPKSPNFTMPEPDIKGSAVRIENLIEDQSTKNRLENGNVIANDGGVQPRTPLTEAPVIPTTNINTGETITLTEEQVAQNEADIADLSSRKKKSDAAIKQNRVNTDKDSLMTAVIKLGGISEAERNETIIDGNAKGWAGRSLIMAEGRSLDDITILLDELGYIPRSEIDSGNGLRYVAEQIRSEFDGFGKKYAIGSRAETDAFEAEYESELRAQVEAIEAEQKELEETYGDIFNKPEPTRLEKEVDEYYEQTGSESALARTGEEEAGDNQEAVGEPSKTKTIETTEKPPAGPEAGAEDRRSSERDEGQSRRVDNARRARIEKLSPEEIVIELYTDKLTGLLNKRAYTEDKENSAVIAYIDLDGLKYINDNMGHGKGDELLAAFGKAMGEGYRLSGDEFAMLFDTKAEATAAMAALEAEADKAVIEGDTDTLSGIKFSFGIATSEKEADSLMQAQKADRESKGLRKRGERPPNLNAKFDLTKEQDGTTDKTDKEALDNKDQIDRERDLFGLDKPEGNVAGVGINENQGDLLAKSMDKQAESLNNLADAIKAMSAPKEPDTKADASNKVKEGEESYDEREASGVQEQGEADNSQGAFDFFATEGLSNTEAKQQIKDTLHQAWKLRGTGQIQIGLDRIRNANDAAHVFASIRKSAQEKFMFAVTDGDGKILSIVNYGKGVKDGATISPVEVAAAVAEIDGSKKVWLAHNHPSGTIQASDADKKITVGINNVMDGLGVELAGHVVIGKNGEATHIGAGGRASEVTVSPTAAARRGSFSVSERMLSKVDTKDREMVNSPDSGSRLVEGIGADDAIILLNTRHSPVGVVVIGAEEMKQLRGGGRVRRILKAIGQSNASAAIIKTNDEGAARNVSRLLNNLNDIRVLDWFSERNGETVSSSSLGENITEDSDLFFSRKEQSEYDQAVAKGLDMSFKARMARAVVMGFDVVSVWYHATNKNIAKFDSRYFGASTRAESALQGVWTVDLPSTARGYAEYAAKDVPVRSLIEEANKAEKKGDWDAYDRLLGEAEKLESEIYNQPNRGQNIVPVMIRGNYLEVDMDGAEFMDVQDRINKIINEARRDGYDGVKFNDLADDVGFNNRPAKHTVIFDPKNIRSVNAAFDPDSAESSTLLASRKDGAGENAPFDLSKDQSEANKLNAALAKYLGDDWSNAYEQNTLPDDLHGFGEAVKAAFGTKVVPVTATKREFDQFNGVYTRQNPNTVYVSTTANTGFINVAGHELLHDLKAKRPDLYEYLLDNARDHFQNITEYNDKLTVLLQPGESALSIAKLEEELIADFMGDSLADPEFLAKLAADNPSKFKSLLRAVTVWLAKIKGKLKGLGSAAYFDDIEAMQGYLRKVLNAYVEGTDIAAITVPTFTKVWQGSPHKHDGKLDSSKIGTGEGAQAYGYGHYLAESEGVGQGYRGQLSGESWDIDGDTFTVFNSSNGRVGIPEGVDSDAIHQVIGENGDFDAAIQKIANEKINLNKQGITENDGYFKDITGEIEDLRGRLKKGTENGYLYEHNLNQSTIDNMLDWDAPLSEQSEGVKAALRKGGIDVDRLAEQGHRGETIYGKFVGRNAGGGAEASQELADLGIPGIKYFDGQSRSGAEGTRNFVIFPGSEGELKAISRNGERLDQNVSMSQTAGDNFYSAVQVAVDGLKQAKGSPAQMLAMIKKVKGVKAEEIEWLGLEQFLDGKKSVTKDEISEFVSANQIQVEEVELGDVDWVVYDKEDGNQVFATETEARAWAKEQGIPNTDEYIFSSTYNSPGAANATQHGTGNLQLPGGENYRELLLTLPDNKLTYMVMHSSGRIKSPEYRSRSEAEAALNQLSEKGSGAGLSIVENDTDNSNSYKSSHYPGTSNILAHVRFNERTDDAGNRVLFIEEVQSDWHQDGRKKGYDNEKKYAVHSKRGSIIMKEGGRGRAIYDSLEEAEQYASNVSDWYVRETTMGGSVPNAPFKKSWPLLSMKRMIRYASENGFDSVAWTTGEQQADRNNLSKQVEVIRYNVDTKNLQVWKNDPDATDEYMEAEIDKTVPSDKLDSYIGKDVAKKILDENNPKDYDGYSFLKGGDLKVGGEGMKSFYDKMLPSDVNKYVKQWGTKVGQSVIDGNVQATLTLTPEMRRSAMQGQPLFSRKDNPTGFSAPDETLATVAIRKIQDKFKVLKDVQANIKEAGGTVEDNANPYQAESLFHGKAENDLRLMRDNYVKPLADKMGKSGISHEQLDEYLMAKHAKERNAHIAEINPDNKDMQDGGSGMSNKEAIAVIAGVKMSGKQEDFDQAAEHVYRMLKSQRDVIRSGQLEDDGLIDAWENKYDFYVPLKGWADDTKDQGKPGGTGQGFNIGGKESKRALGRQSKAASPSSYAVADLTKTLIRARKNEVGNEMLNLIEANPNAEYWEVFTDDNPEKSRTVVKRKDKDTGKMVDNVVEQAVPMSMFRDQYFTTKKDGKTYYMKLKDERLMTAMKNLGVDQGGVVIRSLGAVNRLLSSLNTSLNPEFVLSNFTKDIQTAVLNLSAEQTRDDGVIKGKSIVKQTVKDVRPAMHSIYRSLRGKNPKSARDIEWQAHFDDFRAHGAKTGWFDMKDLDGLSSEMDKLVKQAQGGVRGAAHAFYHDSAELVENINQAVENAVRLSAYVNAVKAGVSKPKAAAMAKDMTVNFNRKGEVGTTLNALYMFSNASIQGVSNFARTMTGLNGEKGDPTWSRLNNAQKMAAGITAGAYFLAMANRSAAGDDDDGENWYDKVPDYVKERNLVIMKSLFGGEEGEYWKFPLPYGYNVFYVAGAGVEAIQANPDQAFKQSSNILMATLGSFSPIGFQDSQSVHGLLLKNAAPTIVKPVVEIALNENFFGSSVFNENFSFGTPKPDSALARRSSPKAYRALTTFLNDVTGGSEHRSGAIDVNPDVLRHIVNFYGGGAFSFASDKIVDNAQRLATGVEISPNRVPFLNRFDGTVMPYEDKSKYYDRRDEIGQIYNESKSLAGRDRLKFNVKHRSKLRLAREIKLSDKRLKSLRKRRTAIYSADITAAERDRRLKLIDMQIKAVIDKFNRQYSEAS